LQHHINSGGEMSEHNNLEWIEYIKVNEEVARVRERILTELGLSIIINGRHFTRAMITPMMEQEFIVGYLFGQGFIESPDDIDSISLKDNTAEITLSVKEGKIDRSTMIHSDFKVDKEDIFRGVRAILNSEIYAETGAIHSAGLFRRGAEPICIAEDVGRHNALDKVIGYALIHKIDFGQTFATSTGRMVSDMMIKVCRANIPIIATKTAVTKSGIEIGEMCGLTIIGFVREKGMKLNSGTYIGNGPEKEMKIYTNPDRIIF
jgi:FdhD protein